MRQITLCIILILIGATTGLAQKKKQNPAYVQYIRKYQALALYSQKTYRIPASITLAQGILESSAGQSSLTRTSNNHFGIKCHNNWKGAKTYFTDDAPNECFRKYKTAEESYTDHSDFLTANPRYKPLFNLKTTDYIRWAKGLQNLGYATSKAYANSLIKIIEDYELYKLDVNVQPTKQGTQTQTASASRQKPQTNIVMRSIQKTQGLPFVYAVADDSIEKIAIETGSSVKNIIKLNEIHEGFPIREGDIIYLAKKKKKADKPNYDHIVQIGESMHSISQQYGIQVKSLYKLNKKKADYIPTEGDVLRLR
ncbi:MAG: glucosaminidase domain-containing protein [Tannerellaceae bacterium]|jgi:flagellum-specific peptidoglycan hydrolase FlgJ|nr:glucosaminidase domain-containing protein [Tannerellaceae bacterium]